MTQSIRKAEHVAPDGTLTLYLPAFSGLDVEVIVLPRTTVMASETHEAMRLQAQSGFAQQVLAAPAEDVWNDL